MDKGIPCDAHDAVPPTEEDDLPTLQLPPSMSNNTQFILNKVYEYFQASLDDSLQIANHDLSQSIQRAFHHYNTVANNEVMKKTLEMKRVIEMLASNPEVNNDHSSDNLSQHSESPCCPHSQPKINIRQRFANHLRELNHILEGILCRHENTSGGVEGIDNPANSKSGSTQQCVPPNRKNVHARRLFQS